MAERETEKSHDLDKEKSQDSKLRLSENELNTSRDSNMHIDSEKGTDDGKASHDDQAEKSLDDEHEIEKDGREYSGGMEI